MRVLYVVIVMLCFGFDCTARHGAVEDSLIVMFWNVDNFYD